MSIKVELNGKQCRYEIGGCGEAVYVYADGNTSEYLPGSEALVIVPTPQGSSEERWQEIAAVALQSIDRMQARATVAA